MRPVASPGGRARTRSFSNSISLGAVAGITDRIFGDDILIVQKSSKSGNVLCTVISRVSTSSSPARTHFDTDRLQSKSTAQHIPRISSHHAAWAHYPRHLSNALSRIGDKEKHQCHYRRIKLICRERQCHCVPE